MDLNCWRVEVSVRVTTPPDSSVLDDIEQRVMAALRLYEAHDAVAMEVVGDCESTFHDEEDWWETNKT